MQKSFLIRNQNFYGLVGFIENPLTLETKLELSRLLFLNPKVSAESAKTIASTYRYELFAQKLLSRMREQVQGADTKDVYTYICDNMYSWIKTNGLLTLSEVVNLRYSPLITPDTYVDMAKSVVIQDKTLDLKLWNKFLQFYHVVLSESEIDELLDVYLISA
jgi:hypothetical protein